MKVLKDLLTLHEQTVANHENASWMQDKDGVEGIIDLAMEAINKEIKGSKLDLGKQISSHSGKHNSMYMKYELKKPDLGIFALIIDKVVLDLTIGSGTDGFVVKAQFSYEHHGRGSNGYDIGTVFFAGDKVSAVDLTMKPYKR